MLKKLTTFWRFLLPIMLALLVSLAFLSQQQTSHAVKDIHTQADNKAQALCYLFEVSYKFVNLHTQSAMNLLLEKSTQDSAPFILDTTELNGEIIPKLFVMGQAQTGNAELVDQISDLMDVKTSLFVKHGDEFIRVATNINLNNGQRAVGTRLDKNGDAYKALIQQQPFNGVVNILGDAYITSYKPMLNAQGVMIGAYFVGNKVDMQVLRQAIADTQFMKQGFIAVQDADNKEILFTSNNTNIKHANNVLLHPNGTWHIVKKVIPNWHLNALVVYPTQEAVSAGFLSTLPTFSLAAVLGVSFLLFLLWQYRRLILNPIGTDPRLAIDVIQGIAQGKLETDGVTAKPGTLMYNVLNMRDRLRDMVNTMQSNAERLELSSSVFMHTHDGIFIMGADKKIIDINPAFCTITGYAREDAIGKTPKALKFAYESPQLFESLGSDDRTSWQGEVKNLTANGNIYDAALDIFQIKSQAGEITHFIAVFSDISSTKKYRSNLEHMAYHDNLTGLPNRTLFAERLEAAMTNAQQSNELLAVCYFDLDDFKEVNDTLGHDAGDQLLVELAQRMRACMRETDTIARMGGDEFAMLLCGLHSLDECELTLTRLLARIKAPFEILGNSVKISASIGYTIAPYDDGEPDTLIRHADHAMYQTKVNGGSGFHMFDTELERIKRHQRQTLDEISASLANHEFALYYQPKVDMRRGKIFGVEALIRWNHPILGLRLPNEFLPQIEHTALIVTLGEWALHETLKQLDAWIDAGLELSASVNIAPRHLLNADFALRLKQMLDAYPKVTPNHLMLEITESAAIDDIAAVTDIMNACKELGVSFALDDFGVGYSSLTYMRRLPVDLIKIDQSFVRDMLHDPDDLALVAGIISLSREFGHQVIAEGVESIEHGTRLLSMGCKLAQGYGIAEPMPAEALFAWTQQFTPDPKWLI